MSFVKRRTRARSDADLSALMAAQATLLASIEASRQKARVSVERFAVAAGLSVRAYYRALTGERLLRQATIAKLRTAQRRAAAGALT